ncbi:MAG: hypothetical protein MUF72_12605 [Elainella sp. Prado103]|jgi:hypothetical protein|nr:hypothetical protein [Elainella sp. Prado103]
MLFTCSFLLYGSVYAWLPIPQPVLIPICFAVAWLVVIMMVWNLWAAGRDAVNNAQQMHKIPCANCQFFTDTHYLKCPVHPTIALSKDAIDCPDYQSSGYASFLDKPTTSQ